jgi:hypothetical protein
MVAAAEFALALACAGCTGDSGGTSDAGGDATMEAADICDMFTKVGDPCPQANPTRCFPMCDAGGCYCAVGMGGGPTWKCTSDFSCVPDCAPVDDACH